MSDPGSSTESHDDLPQAQATQTRTRITLPGALDSSADKEQQEEDKYFKPAVIALVSVIVVSLLIALYYVITG